LRLISKKSIGGLALFAVLGLFVFWLLSMPWPLSQADLPQHTANIENGKLIYNVGGCISCHAAGPDVKDVNADLPVGGKPLPTPIGILYPPNLTPETETGLGQWTDLDFVNAMQKGLSPSYQHLIPAFPYTSYAHMKTEDVLDLRAYLASLPKVKNQPKPNEVWFQPVVRRGLGAWKWIGFYSAQFKPDDKQTAAWNRGAYLVNGPGHCSECHTPRTLFMSSDLSRMFQGGPHPDGKGKVPSLRDLVGRGRYKNVKDLVSAFQSGEELGYDKMSSGGMGEVRRNLAMLPEAELNAIAEYIVSLN
jgi:mono/diheme cytochrome c family protein